MLPKFTLYRLTPTCMTPNPSAPSFIWYGLSLMLLVSSCSVGKVKNGKSKSVQESQSRGIFITELVVSPLDIAFNDSVVGTIETAFVEKAWKYRGGAKDDMYVSDKMFQIVLRFRETLALPGEHIIDWRIWSNHEDSKERVEFTPISRYPHQAFVSYIDYIPDDTVIFHFRRYDGFIDGRKNSIEERELFSLSPK